MKTVKFKHPGTVIKFVEGGTLSDANLTMKKYEALVKRNPNYERLFIVKDKKD